MPLSKILNSLSGGSFNSVRTGFAYLSDLFKSSEDNSEETRVRQTLLSLVKYILQHGESLSEKNLNALRRILYAKHSVREVERFITELHNLPPLSSPVEATPVLQSLPKPLQERILCMLMMLAWDSNSMKENRALICELGLQLEFSEEELKNFEKKVTEQRRRRQKIISSGAGILVALIVIAVFILTATLLRSVIFGLIAAYILLPLEKSFEKRLRDNKGIVYNFFRLTDWIGRPLLAISEKIRRKIPNRSVKDEDDASRKELRKERRLIAQAVGLTTFVVTVIMVILIIIISAVTSHYVSPFSHSVCGWTRSIIYSQELPDSTDQKLPQTSACIASSEIPLSAENSQTTASSLPSAPRVQAEERASVSTAQQLLEQGQLGLRKMRYRFENLPIIRFTLDQIDQVLNNESAQRELAGILLRHTGGIFSFTASVLGRIGSILTDLLLAIFFFLLFLTKMAEFCKEDNASAQNKFLVRTFFNGTWLPNADNDTIEVAQRIIGDILLKLRIWVRGYLILMITDIIVYTTMFFFLGVPYFPILGIIAGCGIFLPYIGPILSGTLTVLVTLATGGTDASLAMIFGIIVTYLIYNGIIEQFILYPAVIGESLGLTTLETIIVVLLGAIFAGIPGMILAVPAASVAKYLVPQIYNFIEELWHPTSTNEESNP